MAAVPLFGPGRGQQPGQKVERRPNAGYSEMLNGHGPKLTLRPVLYPGTNLLSPFDYHRPYGLNFRVRDGIGCVPAGKGTEKTERPGYNGAKLSTEHGSLATAYWIDVHDGIT